MLTSQKLTSDTSPLFSRVDALYALAFPWHEQRERAAKQQALSDSRYALEAWFDGEQFVGMSGSWLIDDMLYIEHLAVDGALRSKGYGKILLAELLLRAPVTVLEIDPLTTEIAHRRLRFYASMGFAANPWAHAHPTYHQGIADHKLVVLSYPQKIDEAKYQRFNTALRQVVMGLDA
ncbi:MAG: GNAT family N-acetyltransferase [Kluyvera sp.]